MTQRRTEKSETLERERNIKANQKNKRKMNRQALVTLVIFTSIFVFMIGYYMYFMIYDSPRVVNNPHNGRIAEKAKTLIRGSIYSADGEILAETDTNNTESDFSDDTRKYPFGEKFAHIVGYASKGAYGIEGRCNYDLSSEGDNVIDKIINDFSNKTPRGCNVYTTLDTGVQGAAYDSLGGFKGAVFAMDPDTGKVIADLSTPSFDPEKLDQQWESLSKDDDNSPLLNRATRGLYIPGSTFKIVTTLEYIREHSKYKKFSYDCYGHTSFDRGLQINCFNGHAHYTVDLNEAFAYSCNSAFATIGSKLNLKEYKNTAEDLLFNQNLPLDNFGMEFCEKSIFSLNENSPFNEINQTSIGQGKTLVVPAHMAMITSAIANNGKLMTPYVIDRIESDNGTEIKSNEPTVYKQLMTEKEAKILSSFMKSTCEFGTANVMSNSSYKAYGKTGTAELDKNDHINSWFVGYAVKNGKKIAVAVVLENITQGSGSATNCAKKIFDEYFN